MNEQDFRTTLHQSMATQVAPPPMSDESVLAAAHQDRRRRRTMWAGTATAATVMAVAISVMALGYQHTDGVQPGAQSPTLTTTDTLPSTAEPTGKTQPSLPSGMTDSTATSGPQYERGVALIDALAGVVPAGYTSPTDMVGTGDLAGMPFRTNGAVYIGTNDGVEAWTYEATVPLVTGDNVGKLMVEVYSPGNGLTGTGCDIGPIANWGDRDGCAELMVDGKRVGAGERGYQEVTEQWAGYHYDDGTTVFVGQAARYAHSGPPGLAANPLSLAQLAALATDPRFKVA
jgi:hypothetical protein